MLQLSAPQPSPRKFIRKSIRLPDTDSDDLKGYMNRLSVKPRKRMRKEETSQKSPSEPKCGKIHPQGRSLSSACPVEDDPSYQEDVEAYQATDGDSLGEPHQSISQCKDPTDVELVTDKTGVKKKVPPTVSITSDPLNGSTQTTLHATYKCGSANLWTRSPAIVFGRNAHVQPSQARCQPPPNLIQ